MNVNLWNRVYNGGWIWFDRRQIARCQGGWWTRKERRIWWCIFGFCGLIHLQTWPWQKKPVYTCATGEKTANYIAQTQGSFGPQD